MDLQHTADKVERKLMKATEYIKRLQKLIAESGSDPEVVTRSGPCDWPDFTAADACLFRCKATVGGFIYVVDRECDSTVIRID